MKRILLKTLWKNEIGIESLKEEAGIFLLEKRAKKRRKLLQKWLLKYPKKNVVMIPALKKEKEIKKLKRLLFKQDQNITKMKNENIALKEKVI